MSGELITGLVETGLVESGLVVGSGVGGYMQSGILGSPSSFRLWLWGIVKSVGLWCLGYWYVPCIIIAVYVLFLVGYNYLWGYLLSKLQKK